MEEEKEKNDGRDEGEGKVLDVLEYIGSIGFFQVCIFAICCVVQFFVDSIALNFLGGFMDHWCYEQSIQNFSYSQQRYIAIPCDDKVDNGYAECDKFDLQYNSYTQEDYYNWNRTELYGSTDCGRQWVYDRSEYASTIRNKYGLVCDDKYLVDLLSSIYLFGFLVGAITCGFISDWFGRKVGFNLFVLCRMTGAFICLYSPNYPLYATGRFILGMGVMGCGLCGYVLVIELVGSKYRPFLGVSWNMMSSVGYALVPCYAYFVRDEFNLQSILTWPLFILLLFWINIPESVRWLISKGKKKDAEKVVRFIAEVNKRELPDKLCLFSESALKSKSADKEPDEVEAVKGNILDLFRYPNLRKKTLVLYFAWFTNSLVYYGLSLNTGRLPGNVYLTTFLFGIIEIPANLIAMYLLHKIGRKFTLSGCFFFGGISCGICAVLIIVDTDDTWSTVFSTLGKAGITAAFSSTYVFTVELYPTPVRNSGLGSCSMMSRVGGILAPVIGGVLADLWDPLPSIIFGLCGVTSGFLVLLLPETLNQKAPETIEEAEAFGKSKKKSANAYVTNPMESVGIDSVGGKTTEHGRQETNFYTPLQGHHISEQSGTTNVAANGHINESFDPKGTESTSF